MKIPIIYSKGDTSPITVRVFKSHTDSLFYHRIVRGHFISEMDKDCLENFINGYVI